MIAHDIARRLESLGHLVHGSVSTAEEAIREAPGADLVLMDIRIDGARDGVAAAAEIRERFHIPVVFLTAHADRATLARAKITGPYGYIVKPLAPAALETSIEMAVYKHGMERELEQREAWLRTTVASAADAILVTSVDGRIELMNPAAEGLTGWGSGEARGKPVESVLTLIDAVSGEAFGDPTPLAILEGASIPLGGSLRLLRRDGQELEIDGTAAPVLTPSQEPSPEMLGVVVALRDVSARRWEERQLRQAQRMETAARLAAQVSHQYANLIESIRTNADRLADQVSELTGAQRPLREIEQAASAASQATRRLAEFGSRQVAHLETVSLNAVLRRMNRLILSAAGDAVEVKIEAATGLGRVRADVAQLEQVILNLVLHASAAMPAGGELRLETAASEVPQHGRPSRHVSLRLRYPAYQATIDQPTDEAAHAARPQADQQDPDPQDLQHLFDPAGAGEEGMALALTHSIVAEHGGYLSAFATEAETTVELLLPCIDQPTPEQPAPGPCGESPAVLLVDYRDHVRAHLHNFFERSGWNLIEAANPEEAIALAQVREDRCELLIATAADAAAVRAGLDASQLPRTTLRVVDETPASEHEIQRPFTQQQLLERVAELVEADCPQPSGTEAATSAS